MPDDSASCACLNTPQRYDHYRKVEYLGVDETKGRFADVEIRQCVRCERYWLHYHVEYEHLAGAGRYFMGIIEDEKDMAWLVPEIAINYIASLDWFLYGGSFFDGQQGRSIKGGPIFVD